jgi:hypothetical protein
MRRALLSVTLVQDDQAIAVRASKLGGELRGPSAQWFGKHCNGKHLQQGVDGRLCSDSWDAGRR